MYKILIVDNDFDSLKLMRSILELSNYKVDAYQYVRKPIDIRDFKGFDLILLEDAFSNTDSLDICKAIRSEVDTPIIFIGGQGSGIDMVTALDNGGDDYITKPFNEDEFMAKVAANIRREERHKKWEMREELVRELFPVTFYLPEKQVCVKGEEILLTSREYAILELLSRYPRRVFTKEEIYETVYDHEAVALFHSISEYIYQIRQKCSSYGINPIKTVRGIGYKWRE